MKDILDDALRLNLSQRLHRLEQIVAEYIATLGDSHSQMAIHDEVRRGMEDANKQAFSAPAEGESLAYELGYIAQKGRPNEAGDGQSDAT